MITKQQEATILARIKAADEAHGTSERKQQNEALIRHVDKRHKRAYQGTARHRTNAVTTTVDEHRRRQSAPPAAAEKPTVKKITRAKLFTQKGRKPKNPNHHGRRTTKEAA